MVAPLERIRGNDDLSNKMDRIEWFVTAMHRQGEGWNECEYPGKRKIEKRGHVTSIQQCDDVSHLPFHRREAELDTRIYLAPPAKRTQKRLKKISLAATIFNTWSGGVIMRSSEQQRWLDWIVNGGNETNSPRTQIQKSQYDKKKKKSEIQREWSRWKVKVRLELHPPNEHLQMWG